MMIPLAVAYAAMYAVQSRGADIIGALWGPEAREAAVAQNVDDVQPDADVSVLCGGYDTAHWDVTSNILHAAGMLVNLYLGLSLLLGPLLSKSTSAATFVQYFLWMAPVYYLPAWVGHLWLQKDIPAVFTYGTTLRGWAVGEYCAYGDLFSGGIVNEPAELVPTAILTYIMMRGIEAMSSSSSGGTGMKKAKAS